MALESNGYPHEQGVDYYELAEGTTVELAHGFARVTFMGSETVS